MNRQKLEAREAAIVAELESRQSSSERQARQIIGDTPKTAAPSGSANTSRLAKPDGEVSDALRARSMWEGTKIHE